MSKILSPLSAGLPESASRDRFADMDPKRAALLRSGEQFAAKHGRELTEQQKHRFQITLEPLENELEIRVEAMGRHARRALSWSQIQSGGHPLLQNAIRITASRLIPIQLIGSSCK